MQNQNPLKSKLKWFGLLILMLFCTGGLRAQMAPPGNALNFSGNERVTLPNGLANATNVNRTNLTFEAWIRPNSLGSTIMCIFGHKTGGFSNPGFSFNVNGFNSPTGQISLEGTNTAVASSDSVFLNLWSHVALVITYVGPGDLYQANIYLNGKLSGAGTLTIQSGPLNQVTKLGEYSTGNYNWNGGMDEIRIWSVAKTQAEIAAAMFDTIPATSPGLIAYYRFDQGTAGANNTSITTLTDHSSNNYHGLINGFNLSNGNTTSNFVESYAMVVPVATPATNKTPTSFTANWTAPKVGIVDDYRLDVATDPKFISMVSGYNNLSVPSSSLSKSVTGLTANTSYYYRVRANKTSVNNQGGAFFSQFVQPGNCLNFDGTNDYVGLPSNSINTRISGGKVSVESWILLKSYNGLGTIIKNWGESPTNGAMHFGMDDSGKRPWIVITQSNGTERQVLATDSLLLNRWYHVAFSADGSNLSLYINGKLQGSVTYDGTLKSTFSHTFIGVKPATNGAAPASSFQGFLNGSLDEIRIYNTARSQQDIQSSMLNTVAPGSAGLIAYYNFNQGTNGANNALINTLSDLGPYAINGTLNNFSLNGTSSNWIESYAMAAPLIQQPNPTQFASTSFTLNWELPLVGISDSTILEMASDSLFANQLPGSPVRLAYPISSYLVSGLQSGNTYYFRARSNKASVDGQGAVLYPTRIRFGQPELPTTLPNLRLWLDASDVNFNGVLPANNSALTVWKDRSGAGNNATVFGTNNAAIFKTSQINGKPAVNFSRVTSFVGSVYEVQGIDIRAGSMPQMTIFTVYRQGTQTGDQAIWGCDDGGWDRFFFSSFPGGMGTANDGAVAQGTYANRVKGAGVVGELRLLTAAYNHLVPAGSGVYFNGQNVAIFGDSTHPTSAKPTLRIGFDGDDNAFNGDIAEIILYTRKLSDCEILQVNKYLGQKYGTVFSSVRIDTSGATTFVEGGSVTLTSSVTGSSYQWLNGNTPISGANAKSYIATTSGNYRVIVTNACADTSAFKTVTVNPPPPKPTVGSFSPKKGNTGSTITITGTNFKNVTGVWFGAAPAASYTVIDSTTITAVVPDHAYLGSIAVANHVGLGISVVDFQVLNPKNVHPGVNAGGRTYFLKDGKLFGYGIYNEMDKAGRYRYCAVEIPLKGSLRGKSIQQISASGSHAVVLATDNTVHTWGFNTKGELGDSSLVNKDQPVEITSNGEMAGKEIIQVLAGNQVSYALSSDGSILGWGSDTLGMLANNPGSGQVTSPKIISSNGSLNGKNIVKLAKRINASTYTSMFAIASDGTIHTWGGNNSNGNQGVGNANQVNTPQQVSVSPDLVGKTIVNIFPGSQHTLLQDKDGFLYGIGLGPAIGQNSGQFTQAIAIDTGITSSLKGRRVLDAVAGFYPAYSIAIDTGGVLHAFGNNLFGQLGDNSTSLKIKPILVNMVNSSLAGKKAVHVAVGDGCTFVTTNDNGIHGFGRTSNYQLGNGLNATNQTLATAISPNRPAPLTDATNLSITNLTATSATISLTAGSGTKRMIVVKPLSPIDTIAPANGGNYVASPAMNGSIVDGSGRVVYKGTGTSVDITGLSSGVKYYVAVFEYDTFTVPCDYDIFKLGSPLTGDFTYNPTPVAPTVSTSSITSITINSATLGGVVSSAGTANVTERGVVYGTTANPTTSTGTKVQIGSGLGSFSQNVTGLIPSTTYHVRAYAINSVGTSYGADSSFTTLTPTSLAEVSTLGINAITETSASFTGNVSNDGNSAVTERGFVISTNANPTTADNKISSGTGVGSFNGNASGLTPSTTYHVRAFAINGVGTSYGADSTFTTKALINLPSVITNSISAIKSSSAILDGTVTTDGGAPVTERGFAFGLSQNPTTNDNKITAGTGNGNFNANLTGLNPATTYHVRAYAINSKGIAYGADSSFTTSSDSKPNNAFSPDGDGTNDSWVIEDADQLKDHQVVVYNIFGQEVFNQIGYDTPWDGKVDGNPVPSGEYYYMIKGPRVNRKGALLIKNN